MTCRDPSARLKRRDAAIKRTFSLPVKTAQRLEDVCEALVRAPEKSGAILARCAQYTYALTAAMAAALPPFAARLLTFPQTNDS